MQVAGAVCFRGGFPYNGRVPDNQPASSPLLQTKLYRPASRPGAVPRLELIARLNATVSGDPAAFTTRLTLISAPAGFGKTTLVAQWLAQLPEVTQAWLSLDDSDNDPVRFLSYLATALQPVTGDSGATITRLLLTPRPEAYETVLTLLINDMGQAGRPIVLTLEDYHVIAAAAVHQIVAYLLDHLPGLLHIVVITRSDPPLPLSRLRAHGDLIEIRERDLRFSLVETRQYFRQIRGLSLTNEEEAALRDHTEGWVAGLQLAALSMQDRADLAGFVTTFTGSNRYIFDYLTDEVLERRPQGTKDFLLQTSILARMCGPLCDAVTGRTGGDAVLRRLDEANLFLIPLDAERTWYRYHHLFAEVLRQRLHLEQPDLVPELHRRARAWLEEQGLIYEAVTHALEGRDYEAAAEVIEAATGPLLHKGASASVLRWLDAMPETIVYARPRLSLARGWTFQWGPQVDPVQAENWAQHAEATASAAGALDADLTGQSAALRSMVAATDGRTAFSRELAQTALANLPGDSPWRSAITFTLGTTYLDDGDVGTASGYLSDAVRLSEADGVDYIHMAAASFLGDIQVWQGRLGRAAQAYEQVLSWTLPGVPLKGGVMARGGLAGVLCERNQLAEAQAHLREGLDIVNQVGGAWAAHVLLCVQSRIDVAQGRWAEALDALEQSYRMGRRNNVALVATRARALHARLQLAQGDRAAAESWANESNLDPDDPTAGQTGWRELEYLALAAVFEAQGQAAEALRLLARLLDAAETQKRFGNAIAIRVQQAVALWRQGAGTAALDTLVKALATAEPEAYCRVFAGEGRPMVEMLRQIRERGLFANYTGRLLSVMAAEDVARRREAALPEPLSPRELDVLHLAAAGASNKAIAQQLVISLPTVKKHIGNILVKLDATNRGQAVARARELGLLDA